MTTKSFAVYFDTPVAYGGIRIGKMIKWDDQAMVRFFYTRLDGTPYVLDFKDEASFRRWLYAYFVQTGGMFDDPSLKLKLNPIKDVETN
jgi:hypothetical protein